MQVLPIALARRFQRAPDLELLFAPAETPPVDASALVVVDERHAEVRHVAGVGLGSVAATAAILFGALFTAVATGILALWLVASSAGTVGQFEDFMQTIGFRDFAVSGNRIVLGLMVIAAAFTLLATALAIIAAGLYNALAATGHGLKVTITPNPAPALGLSADGDRPQAA